jgi:hypothetical protein
VTGEMTTIFELLVAIGRHPHPAEAIARIFGTVNPLPNLAPSWNIAPTQGAAVVRSHPDTGGRHVLVASPCAREPWDGGFEGIMSVVK